MRLQVFVDRRRQFVTECEPGGVSTRVTCIREMIPDGSEVIVVLESDRNSNVAYIVRRKEENLLARCNDLFQRQVDLEK